MSAPESVIAERPPGDGREWDCQCARCGASTDHIDCAQCGGEGGGSRYEEDPLWYDEDDWWPCDYCRGRGGFIVCGNPVAWCEAHPLPGREQVKRDAIEWFTFDAPRASA